MEVGGSCVSFSENHIIFFLSMCLHCISFHNPGWFVGWRTICTLGGIHTLPFRFCKPLAFRFSMSVLVVRLLSRAAPFISSLMVARENGIIPAA
jgi:hypothetical protein